jgi:tRNA/rRNA methyltransferase
MKRSEILNNVSVVLVETLQPGNIGSAARAMKNMGLHQLKLVSPCSICDEACQKMAVGAYDLVEGAEICDNLQMALAGESVVVGTTSARGRSDKVHLYSPREIAPLIWEYAMSQKVSLVFGPERRGLSDKELALCQYLVSIPASIDFPTLNLAQAVLVLAYEIANVQSVNRRPRQPIATESDRQQMFQHMEKTLIQIGFLSQSNPGHIMRSIRRLLGEANLTERDIQILRGIMSQMEWYSREGKRMSPAEVEKP